MCRLFSPLALRGVVLRNRIMVSPMCQYSADNGFAGDWHLVHYGRMAMGGAGMVTLEATAVSPDGRLGYGDLGLWSDDHIPGLSRIAAFLRAEGAVPAIQLGHAGRKACTQRPWHGNGPLGQQDLDDRGEQVWQTVSVTAEPAGAEYRSPKELSLSDIADVIDAWRAATGRALRAGFETLEIHGAHGYLIHSFLSPLSNTRKDAYGGDITGRMRFALEVAEAVRFAWPDHLPLLFRISTVDASAVGWSQQDSIALARALKQRGVDVIDCSSGGIGDDYSIIPRGPGFQVSFAELVKHKADVMTAAVGLITDAAQAEEILAAGKADLIAVGREILFNPNWPLHARLALEPDRRFADWPPQVGWWLARRKQKQPKVGSEHDKGGSTLLVRSNQPRRTGPSRQTPASGRDS